MDRTEFKKRMKSLKSYRELNPGKGYWDWKVELFDEGGELSDDEKIIINRAWAKKVMRDAEAAIEMERGTRQIKPMPLRSFSELLEDSERRREQARRESGIEGLKNIVRGFNRTAGTAASLASLIAGGGWALTRLLSGNRATSLGRVLAPGVIPANTADTAADAVNFVVDPSLSGAAEVGAGIVLGKWKNFGSKARQATELAGLSLNANTAIESYFEGGEIDPRKEYVSSSYQDRYPNILEKLLPYSSIKVRDKSSLLLNLFSKADSIIYTPILDRVEKYLLNNDITTDLEKRNAEIVATGIPEIVLGSNALNSGKEWKGLSEGLELINNKVRKLTDNDIKRIFNADILHISPGEAVKLIPKGLNIIDMVKVGKYVNSDRFRNDYPAATLYADRLRRNSYELGGKVPPSNYRGSNEPVLKPIILYLDNARVGEATLLPESKGNRNPNTFEITDLMPFIGDTLEFVDIGNDFSQGNFNLALFGLGLALIPGNFASKIGRRVLLETNKAGEALFRNLPYRLLDRLKYRFNTFKNDAVSFLRSDPTLFKNWYRSNQYRKLLYKARVNAKANIKDDIKLPEGVTPNSDRDALELTGLRYKHRYDNTKYGLFGVEKDGGFLHYDPMHGAFTLDGSPMWDNLTAIDYKEYLPIEYIYDELKKAGNSGLIAALKTPKLWFSLNYNPGFSAGNVIHINPKHLKRYNFDFSTTAAHELTHSLDTRTPVTDAFKQAFSIKTPEYPAGFSYSHLPLKTRNYFSNHNNTELVARGNQVKNYFGLEGGEPITEDMLKYAAKNYVKDTGMDNNMNLFFSGIKDWNAAAKWLSRYSLKKGGVLRQYKY